MEREFQLSFVSPKKLNINGHSNLRKISEKLLRASCKRKHAAPGAGNLNDIVIGFGFASDWLRQVIDLY